MTYFIFRTELRRTMVPYSNIQDIQLNERNNKIRISLKKAIDDDIWGERYRYHLRYDTLDEARTTFESIIIRFGNNSFGGEYYISEDSD